MQLRHISPRSIDWVDAMDEGAGGQGWEKLGPEERVKLRHQVQYRGRGVDASDDESSAQGFEAASPSR
jgi:hypothetical protein